MAIKASDQGIPLGELIRIAARKEQREEHSAANGGRRVIKKIRTETGAIRKRPATGAMTKRSAAAAEARTTS